MLLFIGAHADDIEIGCGGTVLELLRRYRGAQVHWVVLSSENGRDREARKAARALLRELAATWHPLTGMAEAILLWRYVGGPWEAVAEYPLSGSAAAS